MAREKGTGNLQCEKSGRWTLRVGINGRRLSRSTGTKDRDKAEAFLNRFLAPLGLGSMRLPLAEVRRHYEMSPNRKDLAKSTLNAKRVAWMAFSRWIEQNHMEITELAQVTPDAIAEYLSQYRYHHSASTYNGHVCILREVFRLLADKAGLVGDPWAGVCLLADDSLSRRELTLDEVERLYVVAAKQGKEWKLLIMTGIYTGLRLGDCCRLTWENVNMERGIIQVIPEKTKKHMHGRPVTIPIHAELLKELQEVKMGTGNWERRTGNRERGTGNRELGTGGTGNRERATSSQQPVPSYQFPVTSNQQPAPSSPYVNPAIAEAHMTTKWKVDEGLRKIFKAANITMSIRVEGRRRKSVIASFHSLRHTFVSLSANAGVPLPVVQSIVGHCSTAMTRHYYHENEAELRKAVDAIPTIGSGEQGAGNGGRGTGNWKRGTGSVERGAGRRLESVSRRLRRLDKFLARGIISMEEHATQQARIISEI